MIIKILRVSDKNFWYANQVGMKYDIPKVKFHQILGTSKAIEIKTELVGTSTTIYVIPEEDYCIIIDNFRLHLKNLIKYDD